MAKFHFFTDINLLNTQTVSEAFGPVSGSSTYDEYRLCSLHTASADPSAYAICRGTVFIQPVTGNSSLVNLILKPEERSDINLPIVKYFVYKGIKVDSLIDGDLIALNTNDLTTSIHKSQELANKSKDKAANAEEGTTTDKPSKKALGIDLDSATYPDTDSIDKIMYRDNVTFQFPSVLGGWKIGTFDSANFGFEIITERIGFDAKLKQCRSLEDKFQITKLSGSETDPEKFNHWHKKEFILDYIDPAAFFGSFYTVGLATKTSGGTDIEMKSGNDLYDTVITKFVNKNITYLDIRNEHNYSFNYYKNYDNEIKINFTGTSSDIDYYASGWPILTISNSQYASANNNKKNLFKVSLPIGDNTLPVLYLSNAILDKGSLDSDIPSQPIRGDKFIELEIAENELTNEITFVVPNKFGASTTLCISNYIKLKYFKQKDVYSTPPEEATIVYHHDFFLDNIFPVFEMTVPFDDSANSGNVLIKIYNEETFFDDPIELLWNFTGTLGIAKDSTNITFFAYAIDKMTYYQQIDNQSLSMVTENKSGFTHFLDYVATFNNSGVVKRSKLIGTPSGDIEYLALEGGASALSKANVPNLSDFISLSFTKAEFADLLTLKNSSGFESDYKIFLGIDKIEIQKDTNGYEYEIWHLVLRGFEEVDNQLQIKEVPTTKKIIRHVSI